MRRRVRVSPLHEASNVAHVPAAPLRPWSSVAPNVVLDVGPEPTCVDHLTPGCPLRTLGLADLGPLSPGWIAPWAILASESLSGCKTEMPWLPTDVDAADGTGETRKKRNESERQEGKYVQFLSSLPLASKGSNGILHSHPRPKLPGNQATVRSHLPETSGKPGMLPVEEKLAGPVWASGPVAPRVIPVAG